MTRPDTPGTPRRGGSGAGLGRLVGKGWSSRPVAIRGCGTRWPGLISTGVDHASDLLTELVSRPTSGALRRPLVCAGGDTDGTSHRSPLRTVTLDGTMIRISRSWPIRFRSVLRESSREHGPARTSLRVQLPA